MRILIAGVGNVLRCDDGFGIEVMHRLEETLALEGVEYFESGIAGISLVQKLMDGFDALIIIDALDRGAEAGRVFVLEPDAESLKKTPSTHEATDLHQADPEVVLRMAAALKVLPSRAWIVGCQAADCDALGAPLTEAVARAVPVAVARIREIVQGCKKDSPMNLSDKSGEAPKEGVAATDEILQVMYWLRGENIAPDVAPPELARWVALDAAQIEPLLEGLVTSGLVEYVPDRELRFRLTSSGGHEGGRRFADEFAEMIKPGHYECSDPNCDCRQTGNPADCVHQH